jgi:hypothetical protein
VTPALDDAIRARLEELKDALFGADVRAELAWAARSPIVCELEEGALVFAERTWGVPVRVAAGLYVSPALVVPDWLISLLADRAAQRHRPTVIAALPLVWSLPPCFSKGLEFYRGPIFGVTWPTRVCTDLIVIDPDHCRDATHPFLPSHAHILAHELGHLLDLHLWDRTPDGREVFARAVADLTVARKPATFAAFQALVTLGEISGKVPSAPAVAAA